MTVTREDLSNMPLSVTGDKYYKMSRQNYNYIDIRPGGVWGSRIRLSAIFVYHSFSVSLILEKLKNPTKSGIF